MKLWVSCSFTPFRVTWKSFPAVACCRNTSKSCQANWYPSMEIIRHHTRGDGRTPRGGHFITVQAQDLLWLYFPKVRKGGLPSPSRSSLSGGWSNPWEGAVISSDDFDTQGFSALWSCHERRASPVHLYTGQRLKKYAGSEWKTRCFLTPHGVSGKLTAIKFKLFSTVTT